jgi:hypothetical protein
MGASFGMLSFTQSNVNRLSITNKADSSTIEYICINNNRSLAASHHNNNDNNKKQAYNT